MRIEKRQGQDERAILTGMLVDDTVLGRLQDKWEPGGLFDSKWCNIVGQWCVDYYAKYSRAPEHHIEGLFNEFCKRTKDEKAISLIDRFLSGLSGEYEDQGINPEYVIDVASRHFNSVRAKRLAETIENELAAGRVDECQKAIGTHTRIEVGTGACVNVLSDKQAIQDAFTEQREPIVKYSGALGGFFGNNLERDAFVAFMAPEKRGKSFWLMDVGWRAMRQGRRVAYFEVGDMSQNQLMRRLGQRAAKHPQRRGTIQIPTKIDPTDKDNPVHFKEVEYKKDLSWGMAWKAMQKVQRTTRRKYPLLRLSCHPNSSLSVDGLRGILDTWALDGWTPDVIVVDYADILAPPTGTQETRDQINATWKQLRRVSQERHALVVTATQADAASYKQDTLGRSNFSEDKRKFAHVTGMLGINQTVEEKRMQLMRLNWLVLREEHYVESQYVFAAGCLAIAQPAIISEKQYFIEPGAGD